MFFYEAGTDYVSYSSTLTYRGGNANRQEVLKFVYISINDDNVAEPREHFLVKFTPTKNLYLRNDVIKVFICDDDGGESIYYLTCIQVP